MKATDFDKEQSARIQRLEKWLQKNEFEAAVFLKEEQEFVNGNYLYYGGGHASGEYGAIVIDSSGAKYAVAHEYSFERIRASGYYDEVLETRQSIQDLTLNIKRLSKKFSKRIAFDQSASLSFLKSMKESGVKVPDNLLREFVFNERSIKSKYEISEMVNAIDIAKRALDKTVESLKAGQALAEIATRLDLAMIEEGGIGSSFETDVRIRRGFDESEISKIRNGDLILFDFGTRIGSMYLSDVGRTYAFRAGKKVTEFMQQVCSIKREGLKKIRSGKSGNQIRADIDAVIEEHGFVSTHRPGHQIGLNVHEPYGPSLAFGDENSGDLRKGSVVTWEPGIGIPTNHLHEKRFGMAHMEDMVLVGESSKMLGNLELEY
ncbi:MAG: M24 family metallopeptidase [Nitrososphaerota archaeon]|nr:M24 family metallopeptidase [Nitrososphaerota archaeon]